ncbi:DUF2970 domain-containing protein [Leeia aquatica]|uniref:DUF2970 domain-containing protein n=1 Tax=Leeia aquatica TaxID=2725557 RepID=UPI00197D07CA|nr:DUF2970 domain-containing protein [Leeia aquatica]
MSEPQPRSKRSPIVAVLWSFLGVRSNQDYQQDAHRLTAKQLIITGIVGGVLFVLTVLGAVKYLIATSGH